MSRAIGHDGGPGASELEADVVVVGAGLSGLAAASALVAGEASVIVLEARDRVGGRTLNEPIADGKIVELGGQWIGPGQDRMAALARRLGIETFPTHDQGEHLWELDRGLRRYSGRFPRLSPLFLVDIAQAQLKLERLARRVPLEAPWATPDARRLDEQTVASWMRRNVRTRAGRGMLELLTEGVWAAHPGDLSLLHFLFYVRSAGSLDALIETEGGAQQDRFVGGSQVVSQRLAEELGDRVVLSSPVRHIRQDADGIVCRSDRVVARASRAIVAVPPVLSARIEYDPPLSADRDQLTQRMPQGSVIKCMAIYERPFWREEGLSGQVTSAAGPVKVTFDNSPPDGAPGVLLGFLEGRQARDLARVGEGRRREVVLACLERFFGPEAARTERYVDKVWAEDPWARGCYAGYMTPGAWTDHGRALRAPAGRVHWAGSETATHWCGYMDGAVSAGERAATEVLEALPPAARRRPVTGPGTARSQAAVAEAEGLEVADR